MLLQLAPRANLMFERNIADAENRSDGKIGTSLDPLVVDVSSVGGIEIRDSKLVGSEFDQSIFARYADPRDNDIRRG